jgi:hypothetical protein
MLEPDTAIALAASAIAERDFAGAVAALETVSPPAPTAVLACHVWASEHASGPAFREAFRAQLDAAGERGVRSTGATLSLLVEIAGAHRSNTQQLRALNALAAKVRISAVII